MARILFKPGTFLYPVPAVLVTSGDDKINNVCTIAWTGIVCSDPAMTYVSIRKERYSHELISKHMEFCINLTNENLVFSADYCGVKSGRNEDKFEKLQLSKEKSKLVKCPMIVESPVVLECKVKDIIELGTHDMFLAEIVAVNVDEKFLDENGKFDMEKCELIAYSHGEYFSLGEKLGKFGFSVKKNK